MQNTTQLKKEKCGGVIDEAKPKKKEKKKKIVCEIEMAEVEKRCTLS